MRRKIEINDAAKKFVSRYIRGRKPCRLHTTSSELTLSDITLTPQITNRKPKGIWYGIGDSWIDWCIEESFGGIHQYIYELVLDESKILTINNIQDFEKFEDEHKAVPEWMKNGFPFDMIGQYGGLSHFDMKYGKVYETFGGIEIAPYQYKKRLASMWYYGWDCASGCVWNPIAIKDLRLFAYFDDKKGEFIKTSLQPNKNEV